LQNFDNKAFAIEIDAATLEVEDLLVMSDENVIFAASVAIAFDNDTIVLGSSKDKSLQICKKVDK